MEYKLDVPASEALQQIKDRGYFEQYANSNKAVILLGVGFDSVSKNVRDWESEVLKK